MADTYDFGLSMIPDIGRNIFYEDELLLADNVGEVVNSQLIFEDSMLRSSVQVDFIMILFCLKGELSFVLNKEQITLRTNDVCVIKNNDVGKALAFNAEVFIIGFSNTNYFENMYSSNVWEFRNFYLFNNHFSISSHDMQSYYGLYQMMRSKLTEESFIPKRDFVSKSLSLMGVIFQNIVMQSMEQRSSQLNQRNQLLFEQFITLLKCHFRQQHSLQFYAEKLCLTPKYMSQIINEVSGHFASDWITQYLMDEAKTLLLDGRHTTSQVADALGFQNASYFTRFFKRETGLTPSQYQRK